MAEKIEFNRSVLGFLKQRGYSHIYSRSVIDETGYFMLEPLMENDPRLDFSEMDELFEPINSNDVFDMADGDEFIIFCIILPDDEFSRYKATLT